MRGPGNRSERLSPVTEDKLGLHEVMDRVAIVSDTMDRFVIDHPALVANKKLRKMADKINAQLFDLYQSVGRERFK